MRLLHDGRLPDDPAALVMCSLPCHNEFWTAIGTRNYKKRHRKLAVHTSINALTDTAGMTHQALHNAFVFPATRQNYAPVSVGCASAKNINSNPLGGIHLAVQNKTKVLVDTCVLLDDPEVLTRIHLKGGLPFLTSTVLNELDYNKAGEATVNFNARRIFKEFNAGPSTAYKQMPTGEALLGEDVLTQFAFKDGPVFLVGRDAFRERSNNDGKIIELAKDYRMALITRDQAMAVRAKSLGVDVHFWTGPDDGPAAKRNQVNRAQGRPSTRQPGHNQQRPGPKPFARAAAPTTEADAPLAVSNIPTEGNSAKLASGRALRLGKLISAGGEGTIYETDVAGQVCKIYHRERLTTLKQKKIELMVSRRIERPGICWPTEVVTNMAGEFVGYLMPRANGRTMQSVMFVKPKLEKTFPDWSRRDLVNVAGTVIDHISYLHSLNIVVGDINPLNLLVTEDSCAVWMVDTDSFQIEGFPCPVGTVNFTPPEIQGKNYGDFLRTVEHELFAVATMVFMILLPGKPPYSQQGGGSPAENIKSKNFPYRFFRENSKDAPEVSGKDAPQGSWQFIWGSLPLSIKEAFFNTFRESKRATLDEWTNLLVAYRERLVRGKDNDEMFPNAFKVRDPVQVQCSSCSKVFAPSQRWVDKMRAEGKSVWCPECAQKKRLENMARRSHQTTQQLTGQSGGFASAGRPSAGAYQQNQSRPYRPAGANGGQHRPSSYKQPGAAYSAGSGLGSLIGGFFRALFK